MAQLMEQSVSEISIHALVKRATAWAEGLVDWTQDFNPRPREEGDRYTRSCMAGSCDFNPRPREEGDSSVHSAMGDT